jgi:hypothetical protein
MSGIDELSKTESHAHISNVRCPNYCDGGRIKQEYSNIYAGWIGHRRCEFCKGTGEVTPQEAEKIEKLL